MSPHRVGGTITGKVHGPRRFPHADRFDGLNQEGGKIRSIFVDVLTWPARLPLMRRSEAPCCAIQD